MSRVSSACNLTVRTTVFAGSLPPAIGFLTVRQPLSPSPMLLFLYTAVLRKLFNHLIISGVQTTMATFCKSCPSGCGPFRNMASIFTTVENTYDSWSSTAQESIAYMSSIGFGTLGTLVEHPLHAIFPLVQHDLSGVVVLISSMNMLNT